MPSTVIKEFSSTYARHKYQGIRHHAHRVAKSHNLKPDKCPYCNYEHDDIDEVMGEESER